MTLVLIVVFLAIGIGIGVTIGGGMANGNRLHVEQAGNQLVEAANRAATSYVILAELQGQRTAEDWRACDRATEYLELCAKVLHGLINESGTAE